MSTHSAGIILYKFPLTRADDTRNLADKAQNDLEVLLVHPGGPFWKKKDEGAWSIPKGVYGKDENPLEAAKREFKEETGFEMDGNFIDLGEIRQSGGKVVHAWALERDLDTEEIESNTFSLEWPPKTGNIKEFPEIDKAEWFSLERAREKVLKSQVPLLDRLAQQLNH